MESIEQELAAQTLAVHLLLDSLLSQLLRLSVISPADLREIHERALDKTFATDAVLSALVEKILRSKLEAIPKSP